MPTPVQYLVVDIFNDIWYCTTRWLTTKNRTMCRHFSYLCFVEDSNAHCEFCSDGCNLGGAGLDTSVLFPVRVRSQICVSLLSYEYNQSMCLLYHSGPGGVVVHPTCVRLSCGRANGEFFSTPSEACELGYVAGLGIFFGGGLLKKGHAACWTATGTCGLPDVYCDLRGLRVRISWSTPVNPSQDLVITNYCSLNLPGYAVLTIPLSKPTSCHSAFNEPWVQTSPIESCLVFLGWLRRKKQVVLEGTSATMQSAISSKGSYRRPEDWHHPGNINQELDGLALKTSQNSDHHRLTVWIYWQPNCVSHTHLDQWLWSFLDAAGEHLFCCQVAGASTDLKGLQWIDYWERVVEAPLNDR